MLTLFKKKKKTIEKLDISEQVINFKDMTSQNIQITLRPDNKQNLLTITELKSNTTITLDKEQAILLASILVSYHKTNDLNTAINAIKGN